MQMPFQILLNVALAIVWILLKNSWTLLDFTIGYMLGVVLLYVFRGFLPSDIYLKRIIAVWKLILLFFKELILANIAVVKHVLDPKLDIKPGIFALPTELEGHFEITTLANLITLTPGTFTIDVSPDNKILYIHAINVPDVEEAIRAIKESFEKQIMEVIR
jgi:multicomponent Na+:H+ antiporter subunit E